ncbi:hypothetical protein E8E14_011343 [Neopestalotiopsis sp. 37M]|nr:hypothetical protein E8E14_011343 [Neopestalotiopsis sp. 37M]
MNRTSLEGEQLWSLAPMAKFRRKSIAVPSASSSSKDRDVRMDRNQHYFLGCRHLCSPSRRCLSRTYRSASTSNSVRGDLCTVCWSALVFDGRRGRRAERHTRPRKVVRDDPASENVGIDGDVSKAKKTSIRRRQAVEAGKQWKVRGYMGSRWEIDGMDSRELLTEFGRICDEDDADKRSAQRPGRAEMARRARAGFKGVLIEHSSIEPGWKGILVERARAMRR